MKFNKKYLTYIFVVFLLIFSLIKYKTDFFNNTINTSDVVENSDYIEYHFKNNNNLKDHFNKHGKQMGFSNKEDYEKAASNVINNPNSLHKKESEDNDDVYYLEDSNEIVFVSKDGYIRTYFYPDSGKSYFDKQ